MDGQEVVGRLNVHVNVKLLPLLVDAKLGHAPWSAAPGLAMRARSERYTERRPHLLFGVTAIHNPLLCLATLNVARSSDRSVRPATRGSWKQSKPHSQELEER